MYMPHKCDNQTKIGTRKLAAVSDTILAELGIETWWIIIGQCI